MDLQERLSYLENVTGLAGARRGARERNRAATAQRVEGAVPPAARARARGEIPRWREGAEALPGRLQAEPGAHREPRGRARHLLGPRQAQHGPEAPRARAQEREPTALARARCSSSSATCSATGDYEKATATYARSLAASGGKNPEASACLEDVQVESGTWQEHVAALLRAGQRGRHPALKARLLLRASRVIARSSRPTRPRRMLARAYAADSGRPADRRPVRGHARGAGHASTPSEQRSARRSRPRRTASERARLALAFGTRWVLRHQNVDIGSRFLEEALKLDSDNEGRLLSTCARRTARRAATGIACSRIAEEAATRADDGGAHVPLAQAGTIAWRQMGNLIRARLSFERLSGVSPEHPQLRAFEAQIGETLHAGAQRRCRGQPRAPRTPALHTADVARRTSPCRTVGSPHAPRGPAGREDAPARDAPPPPPAAAAAPAARHGAAAARARRSRPVRCGRGEDRRAAPAGRQAGSGQALQRVRQDAAPARRRSCPKPTRRSRSTPRPPISTSPSSPTRPRP